MWVHCIFCHAISKGSSREQRGAEVCAARTASAACVVKAITILVACTVVVGPSAVGGGTCGVMRDCRAWHGVELPAVKLLVDQLEEYRTLVVGAG